ncbi:efflux RND transporter periplasmic adaptor subunit [Tepidamorphus sp. 3E244]|uniref:efflux RND transporter periplasmic adaptor subunit n=1 Tax=Tepidamorphus sp. 3E244 TaxID=3385498 RepID=UPI0038FD0D38
MSQSIFTLGHRASRLVVIAGFSLLLGACEQEQSGQAQQAPQAPPPSVSIVTVRAENLPIINNLPGRISATRIAEVRPRVAGIVQERVFTQGSQVEQGDVLYRIDPAQFQVQVESAQATLQRAEAAQTEARQQAGRQEELRQRKVVSQQQYDNAVSMLAQADADVASARANLRAAQLDLEYSEVKAPISGRIGRALITEGALVGPTNSESLATIQQLDPVYADFTQSATELLELKRRYTSNGDLANAVDEAPVGLVRDDGTPYEHTGRLLFSEATVDPTTGQVTLRGEFPNPDGDLLPGMYVRVVIEQGVENNAISVPQQAVQRDSGGKAFVFIVNGEEKLERRTVTTGRAMTSRWVIETGLEAGDRVVVEGFQRIGAGQQVKPVEWKAPDTSATSGLSSKTANAG